MTKSRNYGLDVARVVAIIGVIILHLVRAGGVLNSSPLGSTRWAATYWVEILAFCSVNLFGVLSGYLGIYSKKKTSARAIELLSISILYCCLLTLAFLFINSQMGIKDIISGLMPFAKKRYWFLYCYLPISLLQPYINDFINRIEVKQLQKILGYIVIFFLFIPSFVRKDTLGLADGFSFSWLLICYMVGALIRRKENDFLNHRSAIWFGVYFVSSFVLLAGNVFIIKVMGKCANYFVSYTSPIVLLMAVALLIGFKNLKFKSGNHRILTMLSILSFDVYLLHCHTLIYDGPWRNAFEWVGGYSFWIIPLVIVGVAISVGVACLIPAYIRHLAYKKISFKPIVDKVDKLLY